MDGDYARGVRGLVGAIAAGVALTLAAGVISAPRGVMLMNRIGPSTIELFVANADGSGERKLFTNSDFDYDASFSADGRWFAFTSERTGYGQADIYRVHPDGTGVERLTDYTGLDDQAALSPNDSRRRASASSS
jgi:Tol biopolymer transport system component